MESVLVQNLKRSTSCGKHLNMILVNGRDGLAIKEIRDRTGVGAGLGERRDSIAIGKNDNQVGVQ